MIFVLDENMPPKVAAALQALGVCEARNLTDHKPRGTPDEEWLPYVAAEGWYLLTQDKRISRNPHQRRILLDAGLGAFFLTGRANRSVRETMIFLLERVEELVALAERTDRPFIFGIPDRGRIERLG